MKSKTSPGVYAGFDLHAQNFLVYVARLSPREVGALVAEMRADLAAGNAHRLRSLPFVGRLYRPRARRRSLAPSLRRLILDRDGHRCRACGATKGLEIDHIVPVIWGGSDDPENLQVLCKPCNLVKGPRVNEARPEVLT